MCIRNSSSSGGQNWGNKKVKDEGGEAISVKDEGIINELDCAGKGGNTNNSSSYSGTKHAKQKQEDDKCSMVGREKENRRDEVVAVKVEKKSIAKTMLKWEVQVLKDLQDGYPLVVH